MVSAASKAAATKQSEESKADKPKATRLSPLESARRKLEEVAAKEKVKAEKQLANRDAAVQRAVNQKARWTRILEEARAAQAVAYDAAGVELPEQPNEAADYEGAITTGDEPEGAADAVATHNDDSAE